MELVGFAASVFAPAGAVGLPITVSGVPSLAASLTTLGIAGQTVSGIQSARTQSKFAKAEAESARQAAAAEEAADRRRTQRILSKQRAIGAASGVDISSGSLLEFILDSAKEAELSALNIRYGGALKSQSKLQESELAERTIPGIAFGGTAKGATILGEWLHRRKP